MYIRRTLTRSRGAGASYYTYRLVRSVRIGEKVKQETLLNLGSQLDIPMESWAELCRRIEEILGGQVSLVGLAGELEEAAQRYAGQLVVRGGFDARGRSESRPESDSRSKPESGRFVEVDVESLEVLQARSVGVEHAGLWAMQGLGFEELLTALGFNGVDRAMAIGSVIARMAVPGSESSSWNWLRAHSGLGELLGEDYGKRSLMRLYRVSDKLLRHQARIEDALFSRVQTLFGLETRVTLYDLTNTYFEGGAHRQKKAKRGHSKEKRSDCPLVTLGLVLDGSGFVRRSRVFAGNAVEAHTLSEMLERLSVPEGALVILDRGIATEENILWLREKGYRYLVMARGGKRAFDAERALSFTSASGEALRVSREDDGEEVRLYCHSAGREEKEKAMNAQRMARFEAGLTKLAAGLSRPRGIKNADRLRERIGRLKECYAVGQQYQIDVRTDPDRNERVIALSWQHTLRAGSRFTDPGVYCLRTNLLDWDEETLWRTYITLTDIEAVFRSLKSELGLRPIHHSREDRVDGHLFLSVLAYQFVQFLRTRLMSQGIQESWARLRTTLSLQRRVTVTFTQRDGRSLNVRKATRAEPDLLRLYRALGMNEAPGGIRRFVS
ncbi:MAG: IS1634 family transposase [Candidatus Accumulibacter sp.]|jgi:transposase|nr:IS1634 family transposase [Accumulibacter sp.]